MSDLPEIELKMKICFIGCFANTIYPIIFLYFPISTWFFFFAHCASVNGRMRNWRAPVCLCVCFFVSGSEMTKKLTALRATQSRLRCALSIINLDWVLVLLQKTFVSEVRQIGVMFFWRRAKSFFVWGPACWQFFRNAPCTCSSVHCRQWIRLSSPLINMQKIIFQKNN